MDDTTGLPFLQWLKQQNQMGPSPSGMPLPPMGPSDLEQKYPNVFARARQLQQAPTPQLPPDSPAPGVAPTAFAPDSRPAPVPAAPAQPPAPIRGLSPQVSDYMQNRLYDPQFAQAQQRGLSPQVSDYMQNRLYDPQFAQAQQQAQRQRQLGGIGQGFQTIANAITSRGGTLRPIDSTSVQDRNNQEAMRPVNDLVANRQQAGQNFEMNRQLAQMDPTSAESTQARAQFRALVPKIAATIPNLDRMSAHEISGLMANGFKASQEQRESLKDEKTDKYHQDEMALRREETNARLADTRAQRAITNQYAQDRIEQTKKTENDKYLSEMATKISKTQGRANLNAENNKRLQAIERLETYALDANGNPKPLTPQQVESAMTDFASVMAGGGTPTEYAVKSQVPNTWKGSVANTIQYFTAHPQDAGAQGFLRVLANQAKEMKGTIGEQILQGQTSSLPRYMALRKTDPVAFDSLLESNGIPLDRVDMSTGKLQPRVVERRTAPDGRIIEKLSDGKLRVAGKNE